MTCIITPEIAEEDANFIKYKQLMNLGQKHLERNPRDAVECFSAAKTLAGNPKDENAEVNIALDEALALI